MANEIPKKTKGEVKMERYIEDLIRNNDFQEKIKKLVKATKPVLGKKTVLTNKEKTKRRDINKELSEIIEGYEKLHERIKKITNNNYVKYHGLISKEYNLDLDEISYIASLFKPEDKKVIDFMKSMADFDMCKIYDFHLEELNPFNKGDEIIHINKRREWFLNAYPVGIFINPRASKNDILDFVEKRWNWIENHFLRSYADKKLKYGKRKHDQKILDFLWENRFLKLKKLKESLDNKFPKNGLVYYEITKILQTEKNRRLGNLS